MKPSFQYSRLAPMLAVIALVNGCAGGPGGDVKAEREAVASTPRLKSTGNVRSGFACCNLRYSGDQLSEANYAQLPFIPLGTPVLIRAIDGAQAIVEIDGRQLTLRLDAAQTSESAAQWLDKAVLADDPRRKLESFPTAVRAAIQSGRLIKGMTREQAIMSVGYPQVDEKKGLAAPSWRYWWTSFESFYVHWLRDKLKKVSGNSETVKKLTYE
ncbi:MAG: hypothetical protein WCF00_06940 [Azonexus sp.]